MMLLFSSTPTLILRLVSDNGVSITLEHDPVPDAIGFRISPRVINGVRQEGNKQWAHTWDSTRTRHKFTSGFPPYIVEPLIAKQTAYYPE